MANLKEIRERISSVISTQQITKAMKMVSAAKLRRAQQAITQMRPYAERLDKMLANILSNIEGEAASALSTPREVQSALLVVVTSNRGLCGAFNTGIIKEAQQVLQTPAFANARLKGKAHVLCIGKKGRDFFKKYKDLHLINDHVELFNTLHFDASNEVVKFILEGYQNKQFDLVSICYGRFKNAATQYPETVQFLPVRLNKSADKNAARRKAHYIFMPDKATLLEEIVPSILQTSFYKCLLDTHASEHGARMTAMDKATENANERLREMRIVYNKARQEAITKELSEIVGGAAALDS